MQRRLPYLAAAAVALLLATEAFARWGLGLGTPPLSMAHPTIEYMFAPSQDVQRFGNRILINEYGMRSERIPPEKPKGEFRVLALGDSVLNGGSLTDHEDLATTRLSGPGVRVLNASAGSWGPPNMLAYVEEFGLFDSDLLVLVLSSHDAADVPTFAPLDPASHPTEAPPLAIIEAATRYLPRYLPAFGAPPASPPAAVGPLAPESISEMATNTPIPVCVVLHPTLDEYRSGRGAETFSKIREAAAGAKVVDQASFIRSKADYRDGIHHSPAGQQALADAIAACIDGG